MQLFLARAGVALLVLNLVGCTSWQATQVTLSELEGKQVRVTTKEGKRQEGELTDADSLGFAVVRTKVAFKSRYGTTSTKPGVSTFDTTKITVVEHRARSSSRTFAMVFSGLLVLGLCADLVVIGITNSPE